MCITSCSDLLIVMYDCDKTQCKVVRYSGSTKKQTIQNEENGNPLYSMVDKVKTVYVLIYLTTCMLPSTTPDISRSSDILNERTHLDL